MKNSDTQLGLSQIILFDELEDLLICHLPASLHPDWQLAWGQVRGLVVLFCAGEVTKIATTMLYKELEESCDIFTIPMGHRLSLTQHLFVSWWNHFQQYTAINTECAEGKKEVNALSAGER